MKIGKRISYFKIGYRFCHKLRYEVWNGKMVSFKKILALKFFDTANFSNDEKNHMY